MNRTLHWLICAAALLGLLGLFLIYRSMSGRELNIDPHARDAIEKAKRR